MRILKELPSLEFRKWSLGWAITMIFEALTYMTNFLRNSKADSNFKTHGRIRMNICVTCGLHLSQFTSYPCNTVKPRYPGLFRRKLWSKCFVFCCKRLAYVRNEGEYGGDYINWFGLANHFDRLFWKAMRFVPK